MKNYQILINAYIETIEKLEAQQEWLVDAEAAQFIQDEIDRINKRTAELDRLQEEEPEAPLSDALQYFEDARIKEES